MVRFQQKLEAGIEKKKKKREVILSLTQAHDKINLQGDKIHNKKGNRTSLRSPNWEGSEEMTCPLSLTLAAGSA